MGKGRLLVDGTPVYGWGFGGASSSGYALPSRISLEHGIRVPAGATLAIETGTFNSGSSSNPENFSLAGYTL